MLIVNDHPYASSFIASAIALCLFGAVPTQARAAEITSLTSASVQAAVATPAPTYVTLVRNGVDYTYWTDAKTVGEFFAERELRFSPGEIASADAGDAVADGLRIVLHSARSQTAVVPHPRAIVWTSRETARIAAPVRYRADPAAPSGTTAVVAQGRAGLRVSTYRFTRNGMGAPTRTLLASRIVRMPRERVISRGVAAYASLAHVAEAGFASAVRFAGSAINMIATAYTAGCYRCSGITASGVRAGFGVIAVDPRVIPLGTKLFIPGYGRAIAGDTGGAILGRRVDLGMNTLDAAIRYGRRPVTVYLLR